MSTLELSQSAPGALRTPGETAGLPRLPSVSSTADTVISRLEIARPPNRIS